MICSRESMDVYTSITPPVSFLKDSSSLTSIRIRGSETNGFESSLSTPLILEPSLEKEDLPVSTLPVTTSVTTVSGSHISEVPQPKPKQCSYFQSQLNGENLDTFNCFSLKIVWRLSRQKG